MKQNVLEINVSEVKGETFSSRSCAIFRACDGIFRPRGFLGVFF